MTNLQESPGKKRNRTIIKAGVELLREKRAYSQKEVVGKLAVMGVEVSNPSYLGFDHGIGSNLQGDHSSTFLVMGGQQPLIFQFIKQPRPEIQKFMRFNFCNQLRFVFRAKEHFF